MLYFDSNDYRKSKKNGNLFTQSTISPPSTRHSQSHRPTRNIKGGRKNNNIAVKILLSIEIGYTYLVSNKFPERTKKKVKYIFMLQLGNGKCIYKHIFPAYKRYLIDCNYGNKNISCQMNSNIDGLFLIPIKSHSAVTQVIKSVKFSLN